MNEPIGTNNNFEKNEGLLADLITDRTWNDVTSNALKGQLNPSDLNRVEMYCRQLANDLKKAGYNISITTKHDWNFTDLRKKTELERIRKNIQKIMTGYHYATLIYNTVEGFNYSFMNNWEIILNEIKGMLYGMSNYYIYSGVANSGQNKVWQNRFRHLVLNRNQRAYTRLDYIETTGDQYIDTLMTIDDNLQVEVEFQVTELPTEAGLYLFGASNTRRYYFGVTNNGTWWCASSSNEWYSFGTSDTEKHTVIYNNSSKKIIMDGVEITSLKTFYEIQNCFLFTSQTNAGNPMNMGNGKVRVYKMVLSDRTTNVVYRNLIPIKDGNGVACMHDTITGLNFYNKGTGTFIEGKVINELNYLQSQGKQYINTGDLTGNGLKIRMEITIPQMPTATTYILGNNSATYYRLGLRIDTNRRFGYIYTNNTSFLTTNTAANYWNLNTKYVLEAYWSESEHWLKVNGTQALSPTATSQDKTAGPLRIFAYGNSPNAIIKIHTFKVWQNDVLVRDMIPVQDENDNPCYFDLVTHAYYYNATGIGSFLYG